MLRSSFPVATAACLAAGLALAGGSHYVKILSAAELGQAWTPTPGQPRLVAGYPDAAPDRKLDVCVSVGYLITEKGKTSKFVELRSWTSAHGDAAGPPSEDSVAPYIQLAAAVLARRSFVPVGGDARPVFTAETFGFAGSGERDAAAVSARCHIDDLEALVTGETGKRIQEPVLRTRYERRMERGHQCEWYSLYCSMMGSD